MSQRGRRIDFRDRALDHDRNRFTAQNGPHRAGTTDDPTSGWMARREPCFAVGAGGSDVVLRGAGCGDLGGSHREAKVGVASRSCRPCRSADGRNAPLRLVSARLPPGSRRGDAGSIHPSGDALKSGCELSEAWNRRDVPGASHGNAVQTLRAGGAEFHGWPAVPVDQHPGACGEIPVRVGCIWSARLSPAQAISILHRSLCSWFTDASGY